MAELIKIDVDLQSPSETNLFLRVVWARLRARFGRLGWQFSPRRDGPQQMIRIGWATLGSASPNGVEIAVHYKRRGVVDAVHFKPRGTIYDLHPKLDTALRECVQEATSGLNDPAEFKLATRVYSTPALPLAPHTASAWRIQSLDDGSARIGLTVRAFDEADSIYEFETRIGVLVDMLAVWTNCSIQRMPEAPRATALDLHCCDLWQDEEWLDGHPIIGGLLRFESAFLQFGDGIVAGSIDRGHRLIRAARLFHEGLVVNHICPELVGELSTVLLVSALEVVSENSHGEPPCTSCGQQVYKISQRVAELGKRHLGPNLNRFFKDHYSQRSNYLHSGGKTATEPTTEHMIPQLDPSAQQGCAMPMTLAKPHNLIEFTSFVIRAEVRNLIAARTAR